MIDKSKLSPSESAALDKLKSIVQFPIMEYVNLARYPPLSKNPDFLEMAWQLWNDGNDILRYEMPEKFRPYAELEKVFADELSTARKYKKDFSSHILASEQYEYENRPMPSK